MSRQAAIHIERGDEEARKRVARLRPRVPGVRRGTVNERLLRWIVARIVEVFHPRRVVLFGSRARGDHRPTSDIDLFIEMETRLKKYEREVQVSRLFGLRWWGMDLFVYTPAEVRRWRGVHGTLVALVEEEGKVLYERA